MNKGHLYLFVAAVLYSLMGVLIRILNGYIPPLTQVFFRYIGAFTISLIFIYLNKDSMKFRNKKDFIFLLAIGIFGYAFSTVTFTYSILMTNISTALFMLSTYVIFTPLLSRIFLHEKLPFYSLIATPLALFGAFLLFSPNFSTVNYGAFLALISSLLTSFYYMGSRKLKNYPSAVLTSYSALCGIITVGILSILIEPSFYQLPVTSSAKNISSVTPLIWIFVLLFSADNFFAWLFTNKGFQTVKSGIGTIILLAEPVIGAFLGFLLYGEIITLQSFIGIGFIVGAIIVTILKFN